MKSFSKPTSFDDLKIPEGGPGARVVCVVVSSCPKQAVFLDELFIVSLSELLAS